MILRIDFRLDRSDEEALVSAAAFVGEPEADHIAGGGVPEDVEGSLTRSVAGEEEAHAGLALGLKIEGDDGGLVWP